MYRLRVDDDTKPEYERIVTPALSKRVLSTLRIHPTTGLGVFKRSSPPYYGFKCDYMLAIYHERQEIRVFYLVDETALETTVTHITCKPFGIS